MNTVYILPEHKTENTREKHTKVKRTLLGARKYIHQYSKGWAI